ncbi:Thioesterase-like protein 3 [Elsinoe fawcettii]|nr:Thioesterase-like protein 3 [Elsinoe fawcettii]
MTTVIRLPFRRIATGSHVAREPRRAFNASPVLSSAPDRADFFATFLTSTPSPKDSIAYFSSKPWTSRILSDSTYEPAAFYSRHPFPSTENALFSSLSTPNTIPHLLALKQRNLRTPQPLESGQPATKPALVLPEVLALLSLRPGLNAHPGICHGGFQSVILDEITRFLILVHHDNALRLLEGPEGEKRRAGPRERHFTLKWEVEYLAPVTTPRDVLVRAQLIRRVGRKWVCGADVVDEDGRVLVKGESLWVTAKPKGDGEVESQAGN